MLNYPNPRINSILSELSQKNPVVMAGPSKRMMVSEEGFHFHMPRLKDPIQAFTRSDGKTHAVIVYNSSSVDARDELVKLTNVFDQVDLMKSLYGYDHNCTVEVFHKNINGRRQNFIRLYLKPKQLIVLRS